MSLRASISTNTTIRTTDHLRAPPKSGRDRVAAELESLEGEDLPALMETLPKAHDLVSIERTCHHEG